MRNKRHLPTWKATLAKQSLTTPFCMRQKRSIPKAHSVSTVRRIMHPPPFTQRQSKSTNASNVSWRQRIYTTSIKSIKVSLKSLSKSSRTRPKLFSKTSPILVSFAVGKKEFATLWSRLRMNISNGLRALLISLSNRWTILSRVVNWTHMLVRTRSRNCVWLRCRTSTMRSWRSFSRFNKPSQTINWWLSKVSAKKCSQSSNLLSWKTKRSKNRPIEWIKQAGRPSTWMD